MKHLMTYEEICEAMANQHSLDQLAKVRKLTKGIDIGDTVTFSGYSIPVHP